MDAHQKFVFMGEAAAQQNNFTGFFVMDVTQ